MCRYLYVSNNMKVLCERHRKVRELNKSYSLFLQNFKSEVLCADEAIGSLIVEASGSLI